MYVIHTWANKEHGRYLHSFRSGSSHRLPPQPSSQWHWRWSWWGWWWWSGWWWSWWWWSWRGWCGWCGWRGRGGAGQNNADLLEILVLRKGKPHWGTGGRSQRSTWTFTQCIDTEDNCDYLNLAVFSWPDTLNSITKKIKMWRIKLELELDV